MKTLIELYDERPIENVLGTEMFHPQELVLLCPPEVESKSVLKRSLEEYFKHRGCQVKLTLVPVSLLDAAKVEKRLREILQTRKDCVIDISGGTDAALFAAGAVSALPGVGVITYSRRKNEFFEIQNAPYARSLPCTVTLDAMSCFLMAGGRLLAGRSAGVRLDDRLDQINAIFSVFAKFRKIWHSQILYMQHASSSEPGMLFVESPRTIRADRGMATVSEPFLRMLAEKELLWNLRLNEQTVSFEFPDETIRFWLRDIGAVLELEVYRACRQAGCFDDVVLSAVVNWEGGETQRNAVTNEIDVMAVRGIMPMFISCKTNEIKTEALNELAILRDRFGGKGSRAMIVTSAPATRSRAVMRMRAEELGIEVAQWDDLIGDRLTQKLLSCHTPL